MATYTDAEGNEVEVYTPEEVEAASATIKAEYDAKLKEAQDKIDALSKPAEGDKEKNFAAIREAKEKAEAEKAALEEKLNSEIGAIREEIHGGTKSETIAALSGGDKELEKKMEFQYQRLAKLDPPKDANAVRQLLTEAYKLSADEVKPDVLSRAAATRGSVMQPTAPSKVAPELAAIAGKFGLTQEDLNKYGPK